MFNKYESVMGAIEDVKQVWESGDKTKRKYEVKINNDLFLAWDDDYKSHIGQMDEWKFQVKDWTNKQGVTVQQKVLVDLTRKPRQEAKQNILSPAESEILSFVRAMDKKLDQLLKNGSNQTGQ